MTGPTVSAEVLPAALAPLPVLIVGACLLLSLVIPDRSGRREILVTIGAEIVAFALWATSDATTCDASCSSAQEALTLAALGVGPVFVLLATLIAAIRLAAVNRREATGEEAEAIESEPSEPGTETPTASAVLVDPSADAGER